MEKEEWKRGGLTTHPEGPCGRSRRRRAAGSASTSSTRATPAPHHLRVRYFRRKRGKKHSSGDAGRRRGIVPLSVAPDTAEAAGSA